MESLLRLSRLIDAINDRFAGIAKWAVLISCFISAGNAVVRYLLNYSSNAWLEIQWYMFAVCVMLGAAQVLRLNEHVRVDVIYGQYSGRVQAWVDLIGTVFFLMPVMALMIYFSWPLFLQMYNTGEMSSNSGGLIRWPAMLLLPVGFTLLLFQGLSEAIKRAAWLANKYQGEFHYERPLQ